MIKLQANGGGRGVREKTVKRKSLQLGHLISLGMFGTETGQQKWTEKGCPGHVSQHVLTLDSSNYVRVKDHEFLSLAKYLFFCPYDLFGVTTFISIHIHEYMSHSSRGSVVKINYCNANGGLRANSR